MYICSQIPLFNNSVKQGFFPLLMKHEVPRLDYSEVSRMQSIHLQSSHTQSSHTQKIHNCLYLLQWLPNLMDDTFLRFLGV